MAIRRLSFFSCVAYLFLAATPTIAEVSLRVGFIVPLTGNWAEIGQNVQRGAALAKEDVLQTHKGKDLKVDFIFQDTQEEVSGAKLISAYRAMRANGIDLFIGPIGVPGEKALMPIAKNEPVIIICPSTGPKIQDYSPGFFGAGGDSEKTTRAVAKLAFANGARTAAIFGSLQPWESDQARYFRSEFESLGGKIVSEVSPQPEERDLRLEALRISQSKPEIVFFAVFNQLSLAAKALKERNFQAPFYAAQLVSARLDEAQGALENTISYRFSPPSEEFVARYKQRFEAAPGFASDFAYDAVKALLQAALAANTSGQESLREALTQVTFAGTAGRPVSFQPDRTLPREIAPVKARGTELVPLGNR